jgi:hypothetical protein
MIVVLNRFNLAGVVFNFAVSLWGETRDLTSMGKMRLSRG